MNNKLKRIDFSTGIHADEIENNFRVLEDREHRDKLRTIGYGIVEGFHMEMIDKEMLQISGGFFVNKKGEEVYVGSTAIRIDPPEPIKRSMFETKDALLVGYEGEITIPERPYSPSRMAHFNTDSYQDSYRKKESEIVIMNAANPSELIQAVRVDGKILTLDANTRRGQEVYVDYHYATGRVDLILLSPEGEIYIRKGIPSDAPSHSDTVQYADGLIIGLVESRVDGERIISLHYDYRTYTKVFVNEDGILHLNGKKFEEVKMIHFEEPVLPEEHDVWYDESSNKLMIWKNHNGDFGWTVVNESASVPVRQVKIFTPEEFPEDGRTFLFSEKDLPMRFIPEHNQVEVIIDNSPLMSDQFDEVIELGTGEYVNAGIGVRLKDSLDKATYVEVRVHHSVQNTSLRRTFQRTAVFAQEGFVYHSAANTSKEFATEAPYVIGEHQLQVYVEGKKLQEGLDYDEILTPGGAPGSANRGKSSSTFKIRTALAAGNRVSYRIEKNIYSYDNLDGWVDEIEMKADQALDEIDDTNERIDILAENTRRDIQTVSGNIVTLSEKVGNMSNYYEKTEQIEVSSLPEVSKEGTKRSLINIKASAGGVVTVEDASTDDYIAVHYISERMNRILIRNEDYAVHSSGGNLTVVLSSNLNDSAATVYVSGIRFGIKGVN